MQPRGARVVAVALFAVPKGSVREGRGKQTAMSIPCASNNVS